jgi:ABC-2 type transport system permease protein
MYVIDDFAASTRTLQSWAYFGLKKLQLENRRTWLGSGWIFASFAFSAIGIGLLMSELQGLDFREHVRYVALGFASWNFIAASITTGCMVFLNNRGFLLQLKLPKTAFVHSLVLRNFVVMLAQILTAMAIAAAFGWRPSVTAFAALAALPLYILSGYGAAMFLGCMTTRIPDLSELISSFIRIAFFFTPVIWLAERRADRFISAADTSEEFSIMATLFTWNPFAHYIELIRAPILGEYPDMLSIWVASGCTVALVVLGIIALQVTGRRLTYWL